MYKKRLDVHLATAHSDLTVTPPFHFLCLFHIQMHHLPYTYFFVLGRHHCLAVESNPCLSACLDTITSYDRQEDERKGVLAEEKQCEIRRRLKQLEDKKREEHSIRSEFETLKKMVSDLQDQMTGASPCGSRGADAAQQRRPTEDPRADGPSQGTPVRDQRRRKPRELPSGSKQSKSGRMTVGMCSRFRPFLAISHYVVDD